MCAPHLSEIAQDIEARASYNIYQILPSGHLVHYLYPLYVHHMSMRTPSLPHQLFPKGTPAAGADVPE